MPERAGTDDGRLFEYPFDFEAYIQERMKEIDDWDERRFAKTVLLDGLLRVMRVTEEKYRRLEERVYSEIENEISRYAIQSTVISRGDYDPTNTTLFPICMDDLAPPAPDLASVLETAGQGDACPLETRYFRCDAAACRRLGERAVFRGSIQTDQGSCPARFRLTRARRYRDALSHLYDLFLYNAIPWTTVNSCYLDKFFDLSLEAVEEEPGPDAKWLGFQVDLEDWEQFAQPDQIPLWNLEEISFSSKDFVMPCIDSRDYEHELPIAEFGEENGYLVERNTEITGIRREPGRILLRSPSETFENWVGYRVVPGPSTHSLRYADPVVSNRKKQTFLSSCINHLGGRLHTRADLFRRVEELEIQEYIRVKGFSLLDADADCPPLDDMNWFAKDELFPLDKRRILYIEFTANDPSCYLHDAMVQFVVSQIQLDEGEYRCTGVLV